MFSLKTRPHSPPTMPWATSPTTAEGIKKYLGSGMLRGIGPVLAKRIVGEFGEPIFDIIEAEPETLREVSGIDAFRAGKIAAGWAERKAVRDIGWRHWRLRCRYSTATARPMPRGAPVTTATLPVSAAPRPGLTKSALLFKSGSGAGLPPSTRRSTTVRICAAA
jgi:hypothetical protein